MISRHWSLLKERIWSTKFSEDLTLTHTKNFEALNEWHFSNLFLPLGLVIVTLVIIWGKDGFQITGNFNSNIFNGSLPLIALSIATNGYFFAQKFNKDQEYRLNIDFTFQRFMLSATILICIILSMFQYAIQSIFSPFTDTFNGIIQILLSIVIIVISVFASSILFLFQEDNVSKAYNGLGINAEKDIIPSQASAALLKNG